MREVGRGVRRSRAPPSAAGAAGVPAWGAFPEVNRAAVRRLLGLLAVRTAALPASGGGGERGGHPGRAVGAAGEQGAAASS